VPTVRQRRARPAEGGQVVAYVARRSAGAARRPTRHDASGSSLIGMDGTVVRTDRLTKRFGERLAVDSVSLTVRRSEVYGFLGPNAFTAASLLLIRRRDLT
jgi:ABC-type glutathione transport system ATPase component